MSALNPSYFHIRIFNDDGSPASGGSIEFCYPGTVSHKSIWLNKSMTTPAKNAMPLTAGGLPESQFYLGAGEYDIYIKDAEGALIDDPKRISGCGDGGTGFPDPTGPGYLYWDGSVFIWKQIDMPKGMAQVVWAILPDNAPDTAPFGLSNNDINLMIENGYGVASQMQQSTFQSSLSIWYVTGTYWADAVWTEKEVSRGCGIVNLDKGVFNHLNIHPEYRPTTEASNYPAGIYAVVLEGDGLYWNSLVVEQYPDPSYNITSYLKYNAINKTFEWQSASTLTALPTGPAGGDLAGTYPDPVVKQLTGVGAEVVSTSAPFQWEPSSRPFPNGGRGIGYGKLYVGGVEIAGWIATGEHGEHWITTTEWKTAFRSLYTMTGRRWGECKFVYNASISKHMWIMGWDDTGYAYVPHEAASYEANGTLKLSAWRVTTDGSTFYGMTADGGVDYNVSETRPVYVTDQYGNNVSFQGTIPNIGDIQKNIHTNTVMWVGYAHEIVRTQDFQHFQIVLGRSYTDNGTGIYYPTGAIGCDQYGNWIVLERESGTMWISHTDGTLGSWAVLDTFMLDGVAVTNKRLNQSGHNETWANMVSAYGRWVFCQDLEFTNPHYGPAFVYSDDLVNFYSYTSNQNTYSFYSTDTDGVKFFATNAKPSVSPAVFRLLVDEIPAHMMLVCEKGLQVSGDTFLSDLKNAPSLATDENGKVIAGTGGGGGATIIGGYLPTMDPGNIKNIVMPSKNGTRSEVCVLVYPRLDYKITQGITTQMGVAIAQGAMGGDICITIRDVNFNLIAESYTYTDPHINALLEIACGVVYDPATPGVSVPTYQLKAGVPLYLGINYSTNGLAMWGDIGEGNTNNQPAPSYKFDNLTGTPASLTYAQGSETLIRPFLRMRG